MSEYLSTADDGIVVKRDDATIELQQLIDQYISLKQELQNLPDWTKTVPDAETLQFWNTEQEMINSQHVDQIKFAAIDLYGKVKPIYDSGLLPTRFHDEYFQLENYINA